jgi:hypothetical protein
VRDHREIERLTLFHTTGFFSSRELRLLSDAGSSSQPRSLVDIIDILFSVLRHFGREIDGMWRRWVCLPLLGRPAMHAYFKTLQKDHRMPPDPRVHRRAAAKARLVWVVVFYLGCLGAKFWLLTHANATFLLGSPWLWFWAFVPGIGAIWLVQLTMVHQYAAPALTHYVIILARDVLLLNLASILLAFSLYLCVFASNAWDKAGQSQEKGSAGFAEPDDLADSEAMGVEGGLMPRGYNVWKGFSPDDVLRRRADRQRFKEYERRVAEYAAAYLDFEARQAALELGLPHLPDDFSTPMDNDDVLVKIARGIGMDPASLHLAPDTPLDQPQFLGDRPHYKVDPALLAEIPNYPTPSGPVIQCPSGRGYKAR